MGTGIENHEGAKRMDKGRAYQHPKGNTSSSSTWGAVAAANAACGFTVATSNITKAPSRRAKEITIRIDKESESIR